MFYIGHITEKCALSKTHRILRNVQDGIADHPKGIIFQNKMEFGTKKPKYCDNSCTQESFNKVQILI
jgi:hypothetical protein